MSDTPLDPHQHSQVGIYWEETDSQKVKWHAKGHGYTVANSEPKSTLLTFKPVLLSVS